MTTMMSKLPSSCVCVIMCSYLIWCVFRSISWALSPMLLCFIRSSLAWGSSLSRCFPCVTIPALSPRARLRAYGPHPASPLGMEGVDYVREGFYGEDPPPPRVRRNKNNNRGKAENGHRRSGVPTKDRPLLIPIRDLSLKWRLFFSRRQPHARAVCGMLGQCGIARGRGTPDLG